MQHQPNIVEVVDAKIRSIHVQSLDISFNEILDMKRTGEINITPEYQRLFVWSEGAQSRFIESLILEMPVPPIYVIEDEKGHYTLIDGLQRVSSYLHLRGELQAEHREVKMGQTLRLVDCDIVKELNGRTYQELETAIQIKLRRCFVRMEVIRHGSDPRLKYHMFKRLNTGGQTLTNQQLRNCTIRLLDPTFNDFLIEMAGNSSFQKTMENLSEQNRLGFFDQELVLRFYAFLNYRQEYKHDVGDFLTDYMEAVSDPARPIDFDYENQRAIFEKTFSALSLTLEDKAFAFANPAQTGLVRSFSVYHFEAITIGIQATLHWLDLTNDHHLDWLKTTLESIKLDKEFISMTTGGGRNAPTKLRSRIEYVQNKLEEGRKKL